MPQRPYGFRFQDIHTRHQKWIHLLFSHRQERNGRGQSNIHASPQPLEGQRIGLDFFLLIPLHSTWNSRAGTPPPWGRSKHRFRSTQESSHLYYYALQKYEKTAKMKFFGQKIHQFKVIYYFCTLKVKNLKI